MSRLEFENVSKKYGTGISEFLALDNVNFSADSQQLILVVGPSGSGKTTLLNMIATIDDVSSGNIYLDGKDLTEINRKNIAKF